MSHIQLLAVENSISRQSKTEQQKLAFWVRVDNLGYDKRVDLFWAGEIGGWQTAALHFYGMCGENQELWLAEIKRKRMANKALPGKVAFSLRYRVGGEEYWDNNQGGNYQSEVDSGFELFAGRPTFHPWQAKPISDAQKSLPILIAVSGALAAEKVVLHWTKDNWTHSFKTPCFLKSDYWQKTGRSAAANPNARDVQVWAGRLHIGHAFRVQYCFALEHGGQIHWDNNNGRNYRIGRKPLAVMILNLHCYQEANQDRKLSVIARAIDERQADIVCLQEVAEHWNNGEGDWPSNAARIINERLRKPYHLHTDWSHLGFDKYREGVAILSRLPFQHQEARYVSDSHDRYSIHSRKVVMAQVKLPYLGAVNIFSAHLSWIEDGFKEQFQRLGEWAQSKMEEGVVATLLCGDFNIAAGSEGYRLVVDSHQYEDQFLAANSPGLFDKVFRVNDPHWRDFLADDYRIDYVFMHKDSALKVTSGSVLFTEQDYGRVSDHCGYLLTFEPK